MDPFSVPFCSPKKAPYLCLRYMENFVLHVALLVLYLGDHQFQAFDLLIKPERHQEAL
jgi:hypothetical protein